MSALACCHAHGYAHGDVKADNLLVDGEGKVRLSDWEHSLMVDEDGSAGQSPVCYGTSKGPLHRPLFNLRVQNGHVAAEAMMRSVCGRRLERDTVIAWFWKLVTMNSIESATTRKSVLFITSILISLQ